MPTARGAGPAPAMKTAPTRSPSPPQMPTGRGGGPAPGEKTTPTPSPFTATNADGSASMTQFGVSFTDAPLTDASALATVNNVEGSTTGTLAVAAFTDANPGDHTGDF